MSFVLSIHSMKAYKKILLPAINNAEYSIVLNKEIFGIPHDIELNLEVIDYEWKFIVSEEYLLINSFTEENSYGKILQDKDLLSITLPYCQERLTVMVTKEDSSFYVYKKYDIRANSVITIGKSETNDIQYDTLNVVSREHAIIKRNGKEFVLEDISANGVFVNDVRICGAKKLEFGDYINIYGLCIVYLDGIIAINVGEKNVRINEGKLYPYHVCSEQFVETERENAEEKIIYHRSPRQIYKMDEDEIEIEAPPQYKPLNRKPLAMVIGPSLTMVFPMILGCMMSIYASKSNGSTSGVFMYTGIITAIASAIIGVSWTLVNLKYDKKKNEEEELHRFDAYHEYLISCANEIKERYEKNTSNLRKMYLSAEECCKYDKNNPFLWNRNMDHKDFLSHRLGIGDMPFQMNIKIPKERFTLSNDSLAQKPALIKESYRNLHEVPICVDLMKYPLIGIVGDARKKGAISVMHNLVSQIAVSNCYTDVKMAFIYDKADNEIENWEYLKWLPHTWSEDKKTRYIAKNKAEAGDVLYEITKSLRIRMEEKEAHLGKKKINKPHYILFIANAELLEGELITKYIFDAKENYGLSTVFLADSYDNLPNACTYIIQNDNEFSGMFEIADNVEEKIPVKFDVIDNAQLEKLARVLVNIEVKENEMGGDIPSSLTFFDMFGVQKLQDLNVMDNWRKNRTYESMKAVVGQRAGGTPIYLDVHEKYHGPHGLVAGTTGSGKSETLQTYILSLAINYSPDDVGFFLIDYKGGGMANLFDGLPHMIGQISNLSGNQVRRAMVSIKSENKRRQRIFNEHGVNNINLYTRLYKNNEATIPIPHLFIVIDEFAELKREEPDFMRELISVAQVGRSLGVHLILATQKPNGTVDDNIWSNSRFRLCLRVQDKQDSTDMLHRPDAAYITQAGRCYMQVGNDELFELFQSGWSGAVYDENSDNFKADIAHMVSSTGKAALVGNRTKMKQKENAKRNWIITLMQVMDKVCELEEISLSQIFDNSALLEQYIKRVFYVFHEQKIDYPYSEYNSHRIKDFLKAYIEVQSLYAEADGEIKVENILKNAKDNRLKLPERKEKTQLDAVVEYLNKTAETNGYHQKLQLWLPVLPTTLYLDQLPNYEKEMGFQEDGWKEDKKEWNLEVAIGLYDDPVNQAQDTLKVNLSQNGNLAIVGTIVCGKSTLLQTLIYSFVCKYTPAEINIYAIDYSAKMLSAFEQMPHVGGIIYEGQDDKLAKFFTMLFDILEQRKQLFKGGNYSQYVRVHGVVLPSVLVVIDNYANFRSKTNNIYDDVILQLSKDGVSYGIFLIVTGGGFSAAEIPTRLGENLRSVICLEMNDKFQYADAMHTLHIETLPEVNIKGRGLAKVGEDILEFQTALAFEAEDDFKRLESITELGKQMRSVWNGRCARKIPEIPEKPVWSEFAQLEDTIRLAGDDRHLPIGYNAKNASSYGVDLSKHYCYLITGKARSGKTNLLKVAMQSAMMRKGEIVIFDFKGEFSYLSEKEEIQYIDSDQKIHAFFSDLIPDFKERNQKKKTAVQQGMSDEEIYLAMREFTEKYFFISDLGDFIRILKESEMAKLARPFIENILDKGMYHNVFWFIALQPEDATKLGGDRVYDYIIRYKTGMHFGGNVSAQRIFNFDYVPYSEQTKSLKPGIGMIPYQEDEDVRKVVIPLVKG